MESRLITVPRSKCSDIGGKKRRYKIKDIYIWTKICTPVHRDSDNTTHD